MGESFESRFRKRIKRRGECWEWTGARTAHGYGSIWRDGRSALCHRIAYELHFGTVLTTDQVVMHACDNPPCCSPEHLRLGSHADNVADMVAKKRQRGPTGESNGRAKLTEGDVENIRARWKTGEETQRAIAIDYGIGQTTVGKIVRGERWAK